MEEQPELELDSSDEGFDIDKFNNELDGIRSPAEKEEKREISMQDFEYFWSVYKIPMVDVANLPGHK